MIGKFFIDPDRQQFLQGLSIGLIGFFHPDCSPVAFEMIFDGWGGEVVWGMGISESWVISFLICDSISKVKTFFSDSLV